MKTPEPCVAFGIRVGGPRPYIGYDVSSSRATIERLCTETYHKPTKVVVMSTREWRRLQRKAGERK